MRMPISLQDSLSAANRPSIYMTERCTYYLNSRNVIINQNISLSPNHKKSKNKYLIYDADEHLKLY